MTTDAARRARRLGLFSLGGLFAAGGLAGLWRASQFGASRLRVLIACASVAFALACLVAALLQRPRS